MERAFNATRSKYWEDLYFLLNHDNDRKDFLECFGYNNNLKGTISMGLSKDMAGVKINQPFNENDADDIYLFIDIKENPHLEKQVYKKPNEDGLRRLKKSSSLAKKFSQECIKERIILELRLPDIRDYFDSLAFERVSLQRFVHNRECYLKIKSDELHDETPEGFVEIKLSDYYKILEEKKEEEK